MENVVPNSRLKRAMGVQTIIYLVIGAFFSLPGWSEWLQDKLNYLSTHLLDSNASFAEHSLFQAGAFVLVLLMAYLASQIFLGRSQLHGKMVTLIGLNIAYSLSGLLFYLFSQTRLLHDLFAFALFGAMGVWAAVVYFKNPPSEPPV